MLHVGGPQAVREGSHISKMPPHLLNNTIGVFAQLTLRASPPDCLHPFPIPRQNNNASQKLVLKEDNVLLHLLHLLIEVGEDI